MSEEVQNFVKETNGDSSVPGKIGFEFIGEGLTSIMQVPDVAINKVLCALHSTPGLTKSLSSAA